MRISVINQARDYVTEFWGFELRSWGENNFVIFGECKKSDLYRLAEYFDKQEALSAYHTLLAHMDNNPNLIFRMPPAKAPMPEEVRRQREAPLTSKVMF